MEVNRIIMMAALKSVESNRPVCRPMTSVGMVTAACACERPYTVQNSALVYLKIRAVIHEAMNLDTYATTVTPSATIIVWLLLRKLKGSVIMPLYSKKT